MKKVLGYVVLVFIMLCTLGIAVGSKEDVLQDTVEEVTVPKTTEGPVEITVPATTEAPAVTEMSDAERLGVSETELSWLEHSMRSAGWDFDRTDFERVYRLKDDEMLLNPAMFAEYEVTIKDGQTHKVTLNRSLLEE